ncbi:MAG: T9SS-dependent M36 family metallopeptidase [Bacteroidetes bacterium]|nr:T9SS-dependent M36 family metallopeptidase [Bacteroidota bacterium]
MAIQPTFFQKSSSFVIALLCASALIAQDSRTIIQDYLDQNQTELELTSSDVSNWIIDKEYYSYGTHITHVYINQTINGIEIVNGTANFNLLDGQVFSMGDRMVKGAAQKSNISSPALSPQSAIKSAAEQLGLELTSTLKVLNPISSTEFIFDKAGISLEDIPVRLVYEQTEMGEVRLAWDLSINTLDAQNWWSLRVDAETGEILSRQNWTTHCDFETCGHTEHQTSSSHDRVGNPTFSEELGSLPISGAYNVFALPVESPAHGPRSLVINPEDPIASPFGWHDTDGVPGDEYTITRGNNVHAYEDIQDSNTPGQAPDGGISLNFDYPYDGEVPALENLDAATTNLFYMNNIMHDVWYRYGFDEASGNFQEENYTGTGGFENDYVRAEAQDGSGLSNANFSTPEDGQNPRMQMYLWTDETANNFTVNAPPSDEALDIEYVNSQAGFGPGIPIDPITADLVLVTDESGGDPYDACESIANGDEIEGKIAVIRRGTCEFGFKVLAAENEGALAVIIVNNAAGAPVTMGAGAVGGSVTIPSIMLSSEQGQAIVDALENGDLVNGTLINGAAGLVAFDSSFDNVIIAHEYGHGISIRLTGGANNSGCLFNDEQMGEGWSDWFGIMLTMQEDDQPGDPRGIGTYVVGQPNSGTGIRPAPYSTSPTINNFTYAATNNVNSISQPHGIGFIWSTMLWDLNWALIDIYGYDPDMYNGTGGNNIAMQLVIDGLKLQPCSPGFVDGRDAILAADVLNYGGAHQCLIWEVFANRGLGYSASQGSSSSRTDQVAAFDVPPVVVTIDVDNTILIADNTNEGVSYQWIDCSDESEISGATEQTFSPDDSGEYAVMITQNGCTATSECIGLVSVGIENLISENVTLSPNPTNDFLLVDFGALKTIRSIQLMDYQGKVAYTESSVTRDQLRIDLSSFSSGLYMMQVTTDEGSSVFKVVVE